MEGVLPVRLEFSWSVLVLCFVFKTKILADVLVRACNSSTQNA
jgi:hypothetical protein